MIKITKFGGSSTADAGQFRKIRGIIEADPARKFVVVSAAGKRYKADNKVTDLLYLVDAHCQYHVDARPLLADIKSRYVGIAEELGLRYPIADEFEQFADHVAEYSTEYIVSRGEYFTARLMSEWLGLPFVDAAGTVVFHHDGTINLEVTGENLRAAAQQGDGFVLPGFYGTTPEGSIRLLSRGGGDVTGSIVAACLGADLYENWTDVSGFLSADPRIVDNPLPIRRITFDEMRELSYMGASVLQEEAIFPVREANIPIRIKNTNEPQVHGTTIRETANPGENEVEPLITGIAGKKNFRTFHVKKNHMADMVGFMRTVLGVFERYGVSVEHVPTSIDSFGVVVNGADVKDKVHSITRDIEREAHPDEVRVLDGLALISVVGRNLRRSKGTAGRLFSALGQAGVNIRMITQSAQEINITFGVEEEDFERAIQVVYDTFIKEEE